MTDVVNPKEASPDQLLPYHKKISVEGKALIICFISYTYMVLKRTQSIVFTYLRSLIFTFLSQIDVILWANMPILSGTLTTNVIVLLKINQLSAKTNTNSKKIMKIHIPSLWMHYFILFRIGIRLRKQGQVQVQKQISFFSEINVFHFSLIFSLHLPQALFFLFFSQFYQNVS